MGLSWTEGAGVTDPLDTIALLRPYDPVGLEKVRIGARGDGGYVMLDRFREGQTLFSYGVGQDVSFDADLCSRGVRAHLFDHTVSGLPGGGGWATFHREGLGSELGNSIRTLAEHVALHAPGKTGMLLKIDVESAEWMALAVTPDDVLTRFDQIVIEWHRLGNIGRPEFAPLIGSVLAKLHRHFRPFHVHSHNQFDFATVAGVPVPQLLEVSYGRRDLCEFVPSHTLFPTPLDCPCNADLPEHRLWMWPFLPVPLAEA